MPSRPAHPRIVPSEALAHGRRIAGGLAALGLSRSDVVAVLLHHDPVYLSIMHACRICGCRVRQISPHSTGEQIGSALAEPGIKVLFTHEGFLPALERRDEDLEVIAVAPLALFPGKVPAARKGRVPHAYHQWLALQTERKTMLPGRRPLRPDAQSAAVHSSVYGVCLRMLRELTRGAVFPPPREDGASPRSAGNSEID